MEIKQYLNTHYFSFLDPFEGIQIKCMKICYLRAKISQEIQHRHTEIETRSLDRTFTDLSSVIVSSLAIFHSSHTLFDVSAATSQW